MSGGRGSGCGSSDGARSEDGKIETDGVFNDSVQDVGSTAGNSSGNPENRKNLLLL